ncbi:MAG: hypothetical protein FJZ58_02975 [Chlamydiae bacterium]|nr:hypothetical protein [Chlamydiota bacterium]
MKKIFLVCSVGFALFSMFFGSGNLVFPLVVGKESGGHALLAALGIILTGVVVPFLGVFGMMLYGGDLKKFFHCMGKTGTFIFSLLALGLMGPFGVLARCFTVAHGAVQTIAPTIPLLVTSAVFCLAIYFVTVNKNKIVPALGSILTPILLASIAAIAFFAFKEAFGATVEVNNLLVSQEGRWASFANGFVQGYQTMDLLAAFFFSTFVIQHLRETKEGTSLFLRSALLGGGVLSCVYMILVLLGGFYAPTLAAVHPQEMLGRIAIQTLGPLGAPCLCVAVVLACFTTAVVLASLFADFLHKEVFKEKTHHRYPLMITLLIGLVISSFGFSGIARYLGPLVELIYPALIMLTLGNIAHKFWGIRNSHWPVTLTLAAKVGLLRFV